MPCYKYSRGLSSKVCLLVLVECAFSGKIYCCCCELVSENMFCMKLLFNSDKKNTLNEVKVHDLHIVNLYLLCPVERNEFNTIIPTVSV